MEKNDFEKYVCYSEESPSGLLWKQGFKCTSKHPSKFSSIAGKVYGDDKKGYYYRVHINGRNYSNHRVIWVLNGGKFGDGEVIDHINGNSLDNKINNLRVIERHLNNMNFKMYNTNTTGNTGVNLIDNGQGNFYYMAHWSNFDNKVCRKYFSIDKLGIMVAFRDAVIHRQKMIEELNSQGAGYTERHGKE